jgi:subtilisin family serine protease
MDATERAERWRQARRAHLDGLHWLVEDLTGPRPVRYVAGELLVATEHRTAALQAVADLGAGAVTEDEPLPGVRRLRARGLDAITATRRLREEIPDGALVGPNHVLVAAPPHEQGGPFGRPVAVAAAHIDADVVPDHPVRVVVLDTGVWADSPLPASRYRVDPGDVESTVDANHDDVIDSDVAHANFIAGVVLQGCRQADVRVVKVLDTFGIGTELDLAQHIARLSNVDILNLSLGAFSTNDAPPVLLRAALEQFLSGQDRMMVAAAGNDSCADRPFWPAAFSGAGQPWSEQVIAVAAHDGTAICPWSNTGPWVDIAAPGANVVSTYIHHPEFASGWAAWSGTSFATPSVVAALVTLAGEAGSLRDAGKQLRASASRTIGGYAALS